MAKTFFTGPYPFLKRALKKPLFAISITEILKRDATDFPLSSVDF